MLLRLDPSRTLPPPLLGFGAGLDPLLEHPMGPQRWDRLWRRIDGMRLRLLRTITPVSAPAPDGVVRFDTREMAEVCRLLDEARRRGLTVIWGIDDEGTDFDGKADPALHEAFADAVAHLILERGYTCIRFLTLFDRPNYGRSFRAGSAQDNYGLWVDAVRRVDGLLAERGVTPGRARLCGPHNRGGDWHRRAAAELADLLGACAVHACPHDAMLRQGQVEALARSVSGGSLPLILDACGLADDVGEDDRQWHARKDSYGLAMLDLAAQALAGGAAGAVYRTLDDASHPEALWGLWDSTGKYDRDGELRPVAWAWAMLTRCFPPGSRAIAVTHEQHDGFRAAAARVGEGWSVLLVNRGEAAIQVEMERGSSGARLLRYDYPASPLAVDYEGFPAPSELPVHPRTVDLGPGRAVVITTRR